MHPNEQLTHLVPAFIALVHRVEDDELALPTPCTDWTIRDLLEHMISGSLTFAGALRGDAPRDDRGDVRRAIAEALPEFQLALETPGAFDRPIRGLPFGDMDGEALAHYAAFDLLMHAWDLSMATGRSVELPAAVVGEIDSWARRWLIEDYRRPGMFAPATSPGAGASRLERLVAFSGRDLAWVRTR